MCLRYILNNHEPVASDELCRAENRLIQVWGIDSLAAACEATLPVAAGSYDRVLVSA